MAFSLAPNYDDNNIIIIIVPVASKIMHVVSY